MSPPGRDAGTITLAWDPSPFEDVAGYVIFYGTTPGTLPVRARRRQPDVRDRSRPGRRSAVLLHRPGVLVVRRAGRALERGDGQHDERAAPTHGTRDPVQQRRRRRSPSTSRPSPATRTAIRSGTTATGLPAGLSIDSATGIISGTLSYFAAGTHTVTLTVSDGFVPGTLTASQSFTWTVTNVNGPPVVAPIPDQTSQENTPISLAVTASDPDGDRPIFSAAGLPGGVVDRPGDRRDQRNAVVRRAAGRTRSR